MVENINYPKQAHYLWIIFNSKKQNLYFYRTLKYISKYELKKIKIKSPQMIIIYHFKKIQKKNVIKRR